MSVAAGNKQYAASFNLFLVLLCMPALFEVTNQAVACWWQVLFSAFGFGTVLCAELQIACIPCFAICSVGVICF